jgi:putative oligomerization/nucleic acid binding protein
MRGRFAAVAVGASVAKNKAKATAAQQQAAAAQQQAAAAQQQAAAIQQQPDTASQPQQTGQEDITQKLQKLSNLKQQGLISEEEYQKMKSDLLAKL